MSIATAVAPHLPYLRRFARALTGSQTSGDAYVVAVLEAFIEDPNAFARDLPARIALYRAFLKVWNSIPLNTEGNDAARGRDRQCRLQSRCHHAAPAPGVPSHGVGRVSRPRPRRFSTSPTQEVKALIDQAGAEIAEQIAADMLIIEDEPLIAMDLEALVTDVGHRVLGVARTHAEAVAAVPAANRVSCSRTFSSPTAAPGFEAVNEILTPSPFP